jgi:hypothetical protein
MSELSWLLDNFLDHRRLTEQFLEFLASIRNPNNLPEEGFRKNCSESSSVFIEASKTEYFTFSLQKDGQQFVKTITAHSESIDLTFKTLKIIFSS